MRACVLCVSFVIDERTHEQVIKPGGEASTKLSVLEMGRMVRDVVRAVAHCVRHGVLHFDLKQDNVMVTASGKAVLIDFGSALTFPTNVGQYEELSLIHI